MTTAALTAPALAGRDAQPPLTRLTLVELRKMTDTRAGFWLQLAVVALTLAIAGIMVGVGDAQDHTFETMLQAAMQPSVNLLPVIGILLVSSEWSQRTAQQTFTLVPRRTRVVAAKLLASLVVAAAAFAVSILVALARHRARRLRRAGHMVAPGRPARADGAAVRDRDGRRRGVRRAAARLGARDRHLLPGADGVGRARSRSPPSRTSRRGWTARAPTRR